ncbi:MAG: hypothetical protein KL863_25425 [Rhizobium sp.]|nr:hypothetical protein [Rhizobium sp.]
MPAIDITDFSEDELSDLIADATRRRDELRESRENESRTGPSGSAGQDVLAPQHGVITAPTPNSVEEDAPKHGVDRSATVRAV